MAEEEYGEIEGWDLKWHNKDSIINVASKLKHFLKIAVDCGTNDEKNYAYLLRNINIFPAA